MLNLQKSNKINSHVDLIAQNFCGENALHYVEELSKFHRIQASKGYRQAAEKALELAHIAGLEAKIKSYTADGKTFNFTQKMFREWNCKAGYLDICYPFCERVSDYEKEEMSLIARSGAKDFVNCETPIIYIENDISNYGAELCGKLVFIENGFDKAVEASIKNGALGIITVSMPEIAPVRLNMAEDEQMKNSYANLGFSHYGDTENKLCGFVVTPRIGKLLKETALKLKADGEYIKAKFMVDAEFSDGWIENVEITIEGETDEEILLTSHLCHPKSSVNDNVSGDGACLEAMRVLNKLIQEGKLKKPKRRIRLLLIPEFTGTYAYLCEHENRLDKIVAGLNMDMVAGFQDGNAGPLIIVDTPDCAKSFSGDLSELILNQLKKECNFGGGDIFVPLFMGERLPFAFGSDHYILSDPTVDIPSVAITQWPDKTYHTSVDNLEHIDPKMLKRAGVLAASYAYLYSNFDSEIFAEIIPLMSNRFSKRLNDLRFESLDEKVKKNKAKYIKEVYEETLNRGLKLLDSSDKEQISELIENEISFFKLEIKEKKQGYVRTFKAPLSVKSMLGAWNEEQKELWNSRNTPKFGGIDDLIIYEIDGKSSAQEIAERIFYQTGVSCESYVNELLVILQKLNLISQQAI